MRCFLPSSLLASAITVLASAGQAKPGVNIYGVSGVIDMPSAHMRPDGEITTTMARFDTGLRTTLSFQAGPRLSVSFRYSVLRDFPTAQSDTLYDRSFDLRYQFLQERRFRPALTIGIQDLAGTGIYAAEYLVASKTLNNFAITVGLGWGRFGSYKGFENPLGVVAPDWRKRPESEGGISTTGQLDIGQWFKGDAALFAGVTWDTPIEGLVAKVEYSSDAYLQEANKSGFKRRSPVNFGLEYGFKSGAHLGIYSLYGSEIAIQFRTSINPKTPISHPRDPVPAPITDGIQRVDIAQALSVQNIWLHSKHNRSNGLWVWVENRGFGAPAQAIGRVARVLSTHADPSVEQFHVVLMEKGMAVTTVTVDRKVFRTLEFDPDRIPRTRDRFMLRAGAAPSQTWQNIYPSIDQRFGLYGAISMFDPDAPLRFDFGLKARARVYFNPHISLSAVVKKRLAGNISKTTRVSDSILPHVRTDVSKYNKTKGITLERMTFDGHYRLGTDIYGRASIGYLEPMYAGLSAEVLWKPHSRPFALGVELNFVKQRAFDQQFDLRNYRTVTGHVSAYWQMRNGYHLQLDVGRYLAKDIGATITVERVFKNGWRVGGYFTLTDVSFDDFGEGSFDKGLIARIPIRWITGRSKKRNFDLKIQPVLRDGGARLHIANRLYPTLSQSDAQRLNDSWARLYR
ncbi:hypothetical protein GCM10007939_02850 [Amylibacter marinus]|uniref:Exopolysaccharide biosynthesis protein YbjH n=1 Tax=Amylibacter marinus TaxID=1475483 RepID=A0ABQ5VRG5_9RHOB|nr:YjbH domain-containing protein [Amylibacter marinus]GLQ34002.1 hypothetical protein GCM10007939_02850 [Amylibacter marinus]